MEYQRLEREKEIKGMPDEYDIICHILDQPDMKGYCMERKLELEKQYSNKFPEWREFIDTYHEFFKSQTGQKPNIMPRNYKDAKSIIIYFRGFKEGDVISNWKALLSNWNKLDDFQQKRLDLTSIYLDINNIIAKLTHRKHNIKDTPEMREYLGL